jgi:hypothetical protein
MTARLRANDLLRSAVIMTAVALGSAFTARAATATLEEARLAAENYVAMVLERDGSWGEYETARVASIEPLVRGDRQLGYVCSVEPVGYLVLGLYKDLTPVRIYSYRSSLDPQAEDGLTDFIKDGLEGLYDYLAKGLGHPLGADDDVRSLLVRDFRSTWAELTDPSFDATLYREDRDLRSAGMDYQEGETLLNTTWYQDPPYNDHCPDLGCSWPYHAYYNNNALTGCVATAGAMVLKYFNWPPGGVGTPYNAGYDWWYMGDSYRYNGTTSQMEVRINGQWRAATSQEIYAVAQVSSHVGIAVDMDYGCDASSAYTYDLEGAFQGPFRMDDDCDVWYMDGHNYTDRWQMLKREFNANRPVVHRIPGHAVVSDGWRVQNVGGVPTDQVHIVYGWNGSNDGWWALTEVPGSVWLEDYFVREIWPERSIHSTLAESYAATDLYRYFDRDASGPRSDFEAGQRLQVLKSGFLLSNTGSAPSDEIVFHGHGADKLLIFTNGDPMGEPRIDILDGEVKVLAGGQIAVY